MKVSDTTRRMQNAARQLAMRQEAERKLDNMLSQVISEQLISVLSTRNKIRVIMHEMEHITFALGE